jgi:hypothetical protein
MGNDEVEVCFCTVMKVGTLYFLSIGLGYDAVEAKGKLLIAQSSASGSIIANLLETADACFDLLNRTKRIVRVFSRRKREAIRSGRHAVHRARNEVKELISEFFDEANEVDQYFIEILTTDWEWLS